MKNQQPVQPPPTSAAKRPAWKLQLGVLVALNLIFMIATFALLSQMSSSAEELKKLRSEQFAKGANATSTVANEELANYRRQYEEVLASFPSETQLLEFVTNLDNLKRQGVITQFEFATDEPVKDTVGNLGLPVLIEIRGTREQLNAGLEAIHNLDVILKPVKTEIVTAEDGSLILRYGGFLYVDQNYSQN